MNKGKKMFWAVLVILMGVGFSFFYFSGNGSFKKRHHVAIQGTPEQIRPFAFADQNGDTITNEHIKDKIVVVEYFFTTCKSICPIMNKNMNKIYETFKESGDVILLSHTVDPIRDSVAALKEYSLQYDPDPAIWKFLTGDKQQLYDHARHSFKIIAGDSTISDIDDDFIHTNVFVLLDKKGRVRLHISNQGSPVAYDGTNEKSIDYLIKDIKYLQKEK